jgi:hypothetical protein
MHLLRPFLAVAAAGALVAGTAQAAPAGVTGGGFYRDGKGRHATKTMLTIEGRPSGNTGRADYTVNGPGKARSAMRVTLSCVAVSGNTAYGSGRDAAGTEWFVKVVDNGEPGRHDQWGLSRNGDTMAGGIPVPAQLSTTCRASNVATRAVDGGNFQVSPAS